MSWSDIIGNWFRAFFRPSPGMIRAGLLVIAAICLGTVAANLPLWLGAEAWQEGSGASSLLDWICSLLALISIAGFLFGAFWFAIEHLDRAGWVHAADFKMHAALMRDYLRGLVGRDRR